MKCGTETIFNKDGKKVNVYHENGNLKHTSTYNENDKVHGVIKRYYKSGKLRNVTEVNNGIPHGSDKSYYENGNLETESTIVNGLLEGTVYRYYENGKLSKEIEFKNNALHGNYFAYREDGSILSVSEYKNDKSNGLHYQYHLNGSLTIATYVDGILHGDYIIKYPGKVKHPTEHDPYEIRVTESKRTYLNNVLHGVFVEYYDNGVIQHFNIYDEGKSIGISKSYDRDFNITSEYDTTNRKRTLWHYDDGVMTLKECYVDNVLKHREKHAGCKFITKGEVE